MIALQDLIQATGATLYGPPGASEFTAFAYDSRIVEPGQLFLAVVTETGDGHDYIGQAFQAGATGVLCQRPPEIELPGLTCLVVEDTQEALLDYARYILARRQVEVIGIAGSLGKTSTKEAIAAVLNQREPVFSNQGNYNGRFGLPVALGRLAGERIAVLEFAADSYGEVRQIAEATRPRTAVVTPIGHSRLDVFGTLERVAEEQAYLVAGLPPDGLAVLNHDDTRVRALGEHTRAACVTFGLDPAADYWAEEVAVSEQGTALICHHGFEAETLRIPLIGPQHAYTALAAAAVGRSAGLTWEAIVRGLEQVRPLPGRTRLLNARGEARLLDDSYDALPESAEAALATLQCLPARRRWVVLGDMAHLGADTERAHRRLGERIAEVADRLVAKGDLARIAADAALQAGLAPEHVHVTYTAEDAVRLLQAQIGPGDVILLKGSAEARLEQVAAPLLAQPEEAPQVLPRQHRGWMQVQLRRPGRPTWVEIDLEAIGHNVRRIIEIIGPQVALLAVLKADGYGHGAVEVARTALNNGAGWLGVACLGEGIALRQAGIDAPILSLGYTPPWQARSAILHRVTCTVYSHDVARALSRAAVDLQRVAQAHLKVDTGMGRLGVLPEEAVGLAREIADLPGLELDGVFTHFSTADEPDLDYTTGQLARFEEVLEALAAEGLQPRWIHAANSAAILRLPASHYNLVRLGIAMYGLSPSPHAACPDDLRPALRFKCQVAQVKALPAGSFVGYGRAFQTQRDSRIAVIPVGYADGFRRGPHNWGDVLVRGQRAPIVGNVCMDQTMIDVTDIPQVRAGDEAVLIGPQGQDCITVEQVAQRLGTINYEIVSEILARVPRLI